MMRTRARLVLLLLLLLPIQAVRSGEGEVRLLTDETIPLYLARGRELARNEQWETMVDVLQRIVIGDPKVFPDLKAEVLNAAVYSEDGIIFYPARELCLKELAAMPPEGLRAYRSQYDAPARELLAEADAVTNLEQRIVAYSKVYDSYLVSSVGDDALEKAASLNLELGRYYEALALYRRIIEVYPNDTDRDMPMVMAKAAYCAARIGDQEHRDVLLERLASEHPRARIRLEGKLVGTGELESHPAMKVRGGGEGAASEEDWPVAGGNTARARVAQDLPEDLPRKPFWRFKLSARDPRLMPTYVEGGSGSWLVAFPDRQPAARPSGQVHRELLALYPTVRPVIYDGLVLYKDCTELIGRSIGSGAFVPLRGRYLQPLESTDDPDYLYPVRLVRPGSQGTSGNKGSAEDVHRFLDYGGHSVVASGDRIFVVENGKAQTYLHGDAEPRPVANLLVSYDRFSGKTVWAWDVDLSSMSVQRDTAALAAWIKDFQEHQRPAFRGPGVASGGMLYTVAYEKEGLDGVSLWAFDLATGQVRFRTLIHQPDTVRQRLPVGASLAVAGGVVYVTTNAGVLAAIDSLPPGRVRWITRYHRNYQPSKGRNWRRGRRGGRTPARITQGYAYGDPVVVAGKVVLAPPDSDELIAFNAETGKIAWRLPKKALGKVSHILGVSGGVLVMAGSAVTGVDVAKGQLAWGPNSLMRAFAYGRGFVGRKYAYVPTMRPNENRAAIFRYAVQTGIQAPPLNVDVEKLGNLLSVGGRLVVANDDEVMCFSTVDRELAANNARMARDGESGALLLERAHIQLRAGHPGEQVRESFRRALEAAKATRENPRAIRLRAIEYLLGVAEQEHDLGAIQEARTILAQAAGDKSPLSRLRPYEAQAALIEAQTLARLGRAQEAFDALERFLDDHAGEQVVIERRVRNGAAAAKALRGELIRRNRAFSAAFVQSVRARIQAAFEKGDVKALELIPKRYDNAHPTEESSFALARLYEQRGETVEAETTLRELIHRFANHPSLAEAHLRLARILIAKSMLVEARVERNKAVSRLDEQSRARLADLLAEVDRKLPAPGQPAIVPRLNLPLSGRAMAVQEAAPVQIEGDRRKLPTGLMLLADESSYFAYDSGGKLLWKQPNPAGAGVVFGPHNDPTTHIVATAVATARVAQAVRGDLVIGDVFGLTCIDAASGRLRWQRPKIPAQAADQARRILGALLADIRLLERNDDLHRSTRLPAYAHAGGMVVSVHPLHGVEAYGAHSGELLWQDSDVRSPSMGRPQFLGQLIAVGWAHPGRVRVYGTDGRTYNEFLAEQDPATKRRGALLAPPLLDPLGRLLVVSGKDTTERATGELKILNARSGQKAFDRHFQVRGRYARVLCADGNQVVFHDGSSGGLNLHFIDMVEKRSVSRAAADILREVEVVQDGARLFLFTYTLGVADLGARLSRIDLEGKDTLIYELPPRARAYARPLLTRHHVVIAAASGSSARLRLYDREASRDSRKPKAVFQIGGGMLMPEFEIRAQGARRYGVPLCVAVAGKSLAFSTAFRSMRFTGPDTR